MLKGIGGNAAAMGGSHLAVEADPWQEEAEAYPGGSQEIEEGCH